MSDTQGSDRTPSSSASSFEIASAEAKRTYDECRQQLSELWAAPVPDMAAIEMAMKRLDDAHAAFKDVHRGRRDAQRY